MEEGRFGGIRFAIPTCPQAKLANYLKRWNDSPHPVEFAFNYSRPVKDDAFDSLKRRLYGVFFMKTMDWRVFRGLSINCNMG